MDSFTATNANVCFIHSTSKQATMAPIRSIAQRALSRSMPMYVDQSVQYNYHEQPISRRQNRRLVKKHEGRHVLATDNDECPYFSRIPDSVELSYRPKPKSQLTFCFFFRLQQQRTMATEKQSKYLTINALCATDALHRHRHLYLTHLAFLSYSCDANQIDDEYQKDYLFHEDGFCCQVEG
jgi:hypothetical protein